MSVGNTALREPLLRWAKHLVGSETEQIARVDRTIAAAIQDPDDLLSGTSVDRALMTLMLRIVLEDASGAPAGRDGKELNALAP